MPKMGLFLNFFFENKIKCVYLILKIGANTGSKFKAEKRAYIFKIILFKCI